MSGNLRNKSAAPPLAFKAAAYVSEEDPAELIIKYNKSPQISNGDYVSTIFTVRS